MDKEVKASGCFEGQDLTMMDAASQALLD